MATVVAGCYERSLLGFDVDGAADVLDKTLALAAHRGPVKAVAGAGPFLASGGTDDSVRVFDLEKGHDLGALSQHESTVTALSFYGNEGKGAPSHLLSGGEDGAIICWKVGGNWESIRTLRAGGHTKGSAVRSVDSHAGSKVLLSVGSDKRLCLWSLKTGRCVFAHKVPHGEATQVCVARGEVDCYATLGDGAAVVSAFEGDDRILGAVGPPAGGRKLHHLAFWGGAGPQCLLACDDGAVALWDVRGGGKASAGGGVPELGGKALAMHLAKAHASRVKGIACVSDTTFASVCSAGSVRLWDARATGPASAPRPLAEAETGARLTSVCVVPVRHAECRDRQPASSPARPSGLRAAADRGATRPPSAAPAHRPAKKPRVRAGVAVARARAASP